MSLVTLFTDTAEQGPEGPAPTPRGEWDAQTVYKALDLVVHDGMSWIARRNSLTARPDISPDDWQPHGGYPPEHRVVGDYGVQFRQPDGEWGETILLESPVALEQVLAARDAAAASASSAGDSATSAAQSAAATALNEVPLSNLPVRAYGTDPGAAFVVDGVVRVGEFMDGLFGQSSWYTSFATPEAYAIYDDLVDEYDDYVTRIHYGTTATDEIPLYAYDFNPTKLKTGTSAVPRDLPTVIWITGLHGYERQGVLTAGLFCRQLCNEWQRRAPMEYLRWNMRLIVIPVFNPEGFNANTRTNGNGVDLNRNFPTDWDLGDGDILTPGSSRYRGEAPLSEAESQAFVDLMDDLGDVAMIIDHHTSNLLSVQGFALWIGSSSASEQALSQRVLQEMNAFMKREFAFLAQDNSQYNRITQSIDGSLHRHYEVLGTPSILFEATQSIQSGNTIAQQRMTLEYMRRFLVRAVERWYTRRELSLLSTVQEPLPTPSLMANFRTGQFHKMGPTGLVSMSLTEMFTVERGAAADRVNNLGAVETMAANVPRIQYDPVTRERLGILVGDDEVVRTALGAYTLTQAGFTWYISGYATVDGSERIFGALNDDNVTNRLYFGINPSGGLRFNRRANNNANLANSLVGTAQQGKLHRCVLVYDGPELPLRVYVDGKEYVLGYIASQDPVNPTLNLSHLYIGSHRTASTGNVTLELHNVVAASAIFDRPLSAAQATQLSVSGIGNYAIAGGVQAPGDDDDDEHDET